MSFKFGPCNYKVVLCQLFNKGFYELRLYLCLYALKFSLYPFAEVKIIGKKNIPYTNVIRGKLPQNM